MNSSLFIKLTMISTICLSFASGQIWAQQALRIKPGAVFDPDKLRYEVLPNEKLLTRKFEKKYSPSKEYLFNWKGKIDRYLGRCGPDSENLEGQKVAYGVRKVCHWKEGTDGFAEVAVELETFPDHEFVQGVVSTSFKGGFRKKGRDENQTTWARVAVSGHLKIDRCNDFRVCNPFLFISRIARPELSTQGVSITVDGKALSPDTAMIIDRTEKDIEVSVSVSQGLPAHVGAAGIHGLKQGFAFFVWGMNRVDPPISGYQIPFPLPHDIKNANGLLSLFQYRHIILAEPPLNGNASNLLKGIIFASPMTVIQKGNYYFDLYASAFPKLSDQQVFDVVYVLLYRLKERIRDVETHPVTRRYFELLSDFITETVMRFRRPIVDEKYKILTETIKNSPYRELVRIQKLLADVDAFEVYESQSVKALLLNVRDMISDQDGLELKKDIDKLFLSDSIDVKRDILDKLLFELNKQADIQYQKIDDYKKKLEFYEFELDQFKKIEDER